LPKTLAELISNPGLLATEFPEIHAALQELPEKFRQTYIALSKNIDPVNPKPLLWSGPAIPQIELPAFPEPLHSLIAALQGERKAAARLHKMIRPTKKADPDTILKVLINAQRVLPAYLYKNGDSIPVCDTNGNLKTYTPAHWFLDEGKVWVWLQTEVIEAANRLQKGHPYDPKVRLSQKPSEDNPLPLWLPAESRQLIVPDKGGAPAGPRDFKNDETEFLLSVKSAMMRVPGGPEKASEYDTAVEWLRQLNRKGRDGEHTNPRQALMRAAKHFYPGINWKGLKGRVMQI
jgi:hypothetical protein